MCNVTSHYVCVYAYSFTLGEEGKITQKKGKTNSGETGLNLASLNQKWMGTRISSSPPMSARTHIFLDLSSSVLMRHTVKLLHI